MENKKYTQEQSNIEESLVQLNNLCNNFRMKYGDDNVCYLEMAIDCLKKYSKNNNTIEYDWEEKNNVTFNKNIHQLYYHDTIQISYLSHKTLTFITRTIKNEWDNVKKEVFIKSLIFGYFHNEILLYKKKNTEMFVISGNNQIKAINDFIAGKFSINIKGNEYFYKDMSDNFDSINLRTVELSIDSNDNEDCLEVLNNYREMFK